MAWYDEAIFYHIYPLGMTGAPKKILMINQNID